MRLSLFRQLAADVILAKSSKPKHFSFMLEIADKAVCVQVKPMKQARRFTLRVRQASRDILLTVPNRTSLKLAQDFTKRHSVWIAARLAQMPQGVPFCAGAHIPYRGVLHELVHCEGHRGTVWIAEAIEADVPNLSLPKLCIAGDKAHLARRVRDFLKREAASALKLAVAHYSAKIGCTPTSLVLRDTRSRWGSCSASGLLSFSWRLIFAPPFVLDYLAAHEVTHLRHMNHSPQYWQLLAQIYPDVDKAERWLKDHGASLHLYGSVGKETRDIIEEMGI